MGIMVLTNSGHVAIAEAMYNSPMYLAWGDLPPFLGPVSGVTVTQTSGGALTNGSIYTYKVTAYTVAGETNGSSSTLTTMSSSGYGNTITWASVSGALGYNIYGRTVSDNYLYLGTTINLSFFDDGSSSVNPLITCPISDTTSISPWTTSVPLPIVTPTGLCRELGRRQVQVVQYVIPNATGEYITPQGQWSQVNYPTQYIYTYVGFALTDAPSSTIYQFGLFLNTVPAPDYTNAQYITSGQISSPGTLLALENISPIYRNSSSREIHELVMTF
jgi:hypothetical protein